VVEQVYLTLKIDSDATPSVLAEIENLARERCPGVYCLTNPIPLTTSLKKGSA
jgi:hypothetical protein